MKIYWVFVLKFEHFLKESLAICYFSIVCFVWENVQEKKQSIKFQWMNLQKKIWMEKTIFKNDMGFKKIKNINWSIKLHFFVFDSPRDGHKLVDK